MPNTNNTFEPPVFQSKVVPVIVITDVNQAVPMARALLKGGIDVMEITLRHAAGLPAIEAVARQVPEMVVGAGTVTRASEISQVKNAGAQFALSPGMTDELVEAAVQAQLRFMPGVMTPSEVMKARDCGFKLLKLFPASQAGGLGMLKALSAPLAGMKFCPTGGVSADNLAQYLKLDNVAMVGGSWLTPAELVLQGRWHEVTQLAQQATDIALNLQAGIS